MTLLFDRKAELHVFLDLEKYIIKGLDMSFDILATRDSKPNTAKIKVYNLSLTTRSMFSKFTRGIEFWAGYGDDLGMIFRGSWDEEASLFRHWQEGPSWITDIETGDGLKEFQNTYFDNSYSRGTPIALVLKDIAAAMGLPFVFDFKSVSILNSGSVFSGKANIVLDDLAEEHNFQWSIQHGSLEILDRDTPPTSDAVAVELSPDTGLIGTPVITKDGLNCKSLMLSTVKPTRLIKLNPASVLNQIGTMQDIIKKKIKVKPSDSGVYIVDSVRYYGDTMGGEFNCEIVSDLSLGVPGAQ